MIFLSYSKEKSTSIRFYLRWDSSKISLKYGCLIAFSEEIHLFGLNMRHLSNKSNANGFSYLIDFEMSFFSTKSYFLRKLTA